MELIGIYIISGLMVVFGILGLIGILMKISKQGERNLIEKMYKNGDIDNNTYIKYL